MGTTIFYDKFSLTSLNLLFASMRLTQSVQNTTGQRTIEFSSIKSVYFDKFVDRTDGHAFTPPIFSMTSALVNK